MATFLNDTLTGTAGTALESHTGETGATWTVHTSAPSSALVLSDADRARNNSGATHLYYASAAPAGTDYKVTLPLHIFDIVTANNCGLAARLSTVAATYYYLRWAGDVQLFRFVADVPTLLQSWSVTWFPGEDHTLELQAEGAGATVTLTAIIDGVAQTPVLDTDATRIVAAGKVGLRSSSNAATNSTGQHFSSISAVDVGGSTAAAGPLSGSVPLKTLVGGALT